MHSASNETVHVTMSIERPVTCRPRIVEKTVRCCTATFADEALVGLEFPKGTFVEAASEKFADSLALTILGEEEEPVHAILAALGLPPAADPEWARAGVRPMAKAIQVVAALRKLEAAAEYMAEGNDHNTLFHAVEAMPRARKL